MEGHIKCKVAITRFMFPKDKQIKTGDFAIFVGKVLKVIEGDNPIVHPVYQTISLKGNVPHMREGDVFTILFGEPETNDFGTTYNVKAVLKEIDPANRMELEEYFKIMCGKTIAKELMKIDGAYNMLMERNDAELLKVKGIGEARLKQIYTNISTYSDVSYAYVKLEPLGLTKNLINKICLVYGGAKGAVDICQENPYDLIKRVKGVGFKLADNIALKMGFNFYSPIRLRSAILHVLEEQAELGKNYLFAPQLHREMMKIVDVDFTALVGIITGLIEEGIVSVSPDGNMIALTQYLELERKIAEELKRIRDAEKYIKVPKDWQEIITEIEEEQGWEHTDEQLLGIKATLDENLVVISGEAGTGKSTITNVMTKILKKYTIDMCCLSAKASQRLREVSGVEAQTIHRLLGIGMGEEEEESTIYSDIVILDEASMVSGTLFLKLLRAIPSGCKLIILGDSGQLTAIGDCAVFADLIACKEVCHINLTKIHRQAEKSAIITKSRAIRRQKPIVEKDFRGTQVMGELQDLEVTVNENSDFILEQIKKNFTRDLKAVGNILEVQVITPLKSKGILSCKNINSEIQKMVNFRMSKSFKGIEGVEIFEGDKIINLKNNYNCKTPKEWDGTSKKTSIFNGSIGIVKEIKDGSAIVYFVGIGNVELEEKDFANINLGYAISGHSSQGSQWERVICAFDMSSYVMLNVEMLYTVLTRAMKYCTLIISPQAMRQALATVEQKTKQTLLTSFLENK